MKKSEDKVMSIVRIGPKGQIVIPKEMRDLFGIETGDSLLMLADKDRGMVLHKLSYFKSFAEEMMNRGMQGAESAFMQEIREAEKEENL